MNKIRIGILGTADIAYRRFLPALKKCDCFDYVGVAARYISKTQKFIDSFGGVGYSSYDKLLADSNIDAVYIPLPPALHFEWGKKALNAGKHLLMEKPFTINVKETEQLLKLAKEKKLAVHENYMFLYHSQLAKIKELIADGALGEIRLYRMSFGFPMRSQGDFRYNKELGGGALLDCGGYPIRLAIDLLGDTAKVVQSKLVQPKGFEVDLYGNAVMENDNGIVAQISFGMDNAYQCQLEVWGSKATLIAPRIFTAGEGVKPVLIIRSSYDESKIELEADDQFYNSINLFYQSIMKKVLLREEFGNILVQSKVVEGIKGVKI